jgi:hypothetical protein
VNDSLLQFIDSLSIDDLIDLKIASLRKQLVDLQALKELRGCPEPSDNDPAEMERRILCSQEKPIVRPKVVTPESNGHNRASDGEDRQFRLTKEKRVVLEFLEHQPRTLRLLLDGCQVSGRAVGNYVRNRLIEKASMGEDGWLYGITDLGRTLLAKIRDLTPEPSRDESQGVAGG